MGGPMPVPDLNSEPDIKLFGSVGDSMFDRFQEQMDEVRDKDKPIILELTTTGGDAETGRRIVLDIQTCREVHKKEIYFLGKTVVYSAGITIMSAFPQQYRYITKDTVLLIHERRMDKEFSLKGKPLAACRQITQQINSQMEMAQKLEDEGFGRLAEGTKLSAEQIGERALGNWYVRAEEAKELGLVAGLV